MTRIMEIAGLVVLGLSAGFVIGAPRYTCYLIRNLFEKMKVLA